MRVDGVMAVRAGALVLWAVAFGALWVSGAADRYVGPRTAWIVPAGTIGLTITALACLPGVLRPPYRPAPRGELLGALVFALPVLGLVAVPGAELGPLAAQQRAEAGAALVAPSEVRGGPIDLVDVSLAGQEEGYAQERGMRPGMTVTIEGFVSARNSRGFSVSRFRLLCCAADAVPSTAPVVGRPAPALDRWVRVRGTLTRWYEVRAQTVREIPRPAKPYL